MTNVETKKINSKTKEILDKYWDDFLHAYWWQECKSCGGHSSFWRTVILSEEWKKWKKHNNDMNWDYSENEELGIISPQHFKAFIEFLKTNK